MVWQYVNRGEAKNGSAKWKNFMEKNLHTVIHTKNSWETEKLTDFEKAIFFHIFPKLQVFVFQKPVGKTLSFAWQLCLFIVAVEAALLAAAAVFSILAWTPRGGIHMFDRLKVWCMCMYVVYKMYTFWYLSMVHLSGSKGIERCMCMWCMWWPFLGVWKVQMDICMLHVDACWCMLMHVVLAIDMELEEKMWQFVTICDSKKKQKAF